MLHNFVYSSMKSNSLLQMYNARHVNAIIDQFRSAEEVSRAIRKAGLESSNLIFGKLFMVFSKR